MYFWKIVVFSSTTIEIGLEHIPPDLGPKASSYRILFRGIAIFHSPRSRNYLLPSASFQWSQKLHMYTFQPSYDLQSKLSFLSDSLVKLTIFRKPTFCFKFASLAQWQSGAFVKRRLEFDSLKRLCKKLCLTLRNKE